MPKEIIDLELEEISFVEEGDNKNANITSIKQKPKEVIMANEVKKELTPDDLMAMMEKLESMFAMVQSALDNGETSEHDTEKVGDVDSEHEDDEEDKSAHEDEDEMEKSKTVEVSKELTDLTKERDDAIELVKEFHEKDTIAKFAKSATELKNLPIKTDVLAKALRAINSLAEKDSIIDMLKTLNTQSAESALLKTVGANGEGNLDNDAKLKSIAKKIQSEDKVTYAKAFTIALDRNPELYKGAK